MEDQNKIEYEEFLKWKETHKEIQEPIQTQPLPVQPQAIQPLPVQALPVQPQAIPVQPLPVSDYEYPTPQKIPKKKGRFRKWFFKGRIEKRKAKEEIIEALSKEYNESRILNIGERNG